jgi:glutamate-1-semialdehyde 2,1-aminomutase
MLPRMSLLDLTDPAADWPVPADRSHALFDRARNVLPGGVNGASRLLAPFPIAMTRAEGAHIEDADGNRYLDFHSGFGSVLLGHNDPRLREAVAETLDRHGVTFATAHPLEVELAERLCALVPCAEQAVFSCIGTEVTYHAIRLARVHTGRRLLLKFEGNYHGWHDYAYFNVRFDIADAGPDDDPRPVPSSGGMGDAADDVLMCQYNDTAHVEELFARHPEEIAALIVEPIYHNGGVVMPEPGFLETCRELCTRHGTVLIFDEVITGFRQALGGAQSLLGITPDLTTLGKAIANGYPVAVLAGRKEVMADLAPLGEAYYSGTFNGHLLNTAVALRCLEILEADPPYERLAALGTALRDGFDQAIADTGAAASVGQLGSVFSLYFTRRKIRSYRDIARYSSGRGGAVQAAYQKHLVSQGIYTHYQGYVIRGYLTGAHTREHVDALVTATRGFLELHGDELQEEAA